MRLMQRILTRCRQSTLLASRGLSGWSKPDVQAPAAGPRLWTLERWDWPCNVPNATLVQIPARTRERAAVRGRRTAPRNSLLPPSTAPSAPETGPHAPPG